MSFDHALTDSGCDRATAYHMSNKIVRHAQGLFVTWLDAQYRCVIGQVDAVSGALLQAYPIAQGCDNHCGAALALTSDGRLHAVCGAHAQSGFTYRYSDSPADPASWSIPAGLGCNSTYPGLVAMPDDLLVCTYRSTSRTDGHWGCALQSLKPGDLWWSNLRRLTVSPFTRYTYTTNSVTYDLDGTLHILVEFYATPPDFPQAAQRSLGLTHLMKAGDGEPFRHSDGRPLSPYPADFSDCCVFAHTKTGNPRPGNIDAGVDGTLSVCATDTAAGTLHLHRWDGAGHWPVLADLTAAAVGDSAGWSVNSQGRITHLADGSLIVVTTISPDGAWASGQQQIVCLRLDPTTGELRDRYTVDKTDPDSAQWLASVELRHGPCIDDAPYMIYTDGNRGEGCVNEASTSVRIHRLFA